MKDFDIGTLRNVSRKIVLTPEMQALWESMAVGVAVVNAQGVCEYMNSIQRRTDGFTHINVVGQHITNLYLPHERDLIPTMECLQKKAPLLKRAYWYKTTNNYLASTVTDFFPLFDNGEIDGCIAFIIWLGPTLINGKRDRCKAPAFSGHTSGLYTFDSIVGRNAQLLDVIHAAKAAAKTSASVMIWGESGVGKEVFAQGIHSESERSGKPFIPVNCAAIPENLLEGILFGTVKGAYTDATDKAGLFEKADGGTLLLDELNSMPLTLQTKLLRVLQEKRVCRLGSYSEIPVDVRIVSVLNEPPLAAVERGILRLDLFYRLAVVGLEIPPLRERKDDIPILAHSFVEVSDLRADHKSIRFSDDVFQQFLEYSWPGNIRELAHVIECCLVMLGSADVITDSCLPPHFRKAHMHAEHAAAPAASTASVPVEASAVRSYFDYAEVQRGEVVPLKQCLNDYERHCIQNVLRVTGGNVAKAARIFRMTAAGLRYRIKTLDISDGY
ncbi:sigma54 specific transcriptional regulator, Fis family [Pseudodesulfovibrio mercurii]|uniref:Sigma54 specific transcriptional regulator, Fis family n=2 Tax=Pseudodesulfovibrio mercurii TaxID=641491 RepID=F0JEY7_9BACT|nr:sigma54 specific transcriptional regulator, Fis family [Pseudodesulfovibrio mercurii]